MIVPYNKTSMEEFYSEISADFDKKYTHPFRV